MKETEQGREWNDTIVELRATEFVETVTEEDFPGGPGPPGGNRLWPTHTERALCA